MAITNLYSKRKRALKGDVSDIYSYDEISEKLRVQIVHIINDAIGVCATFSNMRSYGYQRDHSDQAYMDICKTLRQEYGVFELSRNANSYYNEVYDFFLNTESVDECLDIIELSFSVIDGYVRKNKYYFKSNADEAINDLNQRFKENSVGYQFENGEIIRVDSQFVHAEVVKPILLVLSSSSEYEGVLDEFMSAHEHYRHGKYKECLNDCLKSFESLMKSIHKRNSWAFNETDTAKKLINSCLENKLIPEYLQNQFSSMRILLESGIPTIRNKEGGHGQGPDIVDVPEHLASYTIHLTATNLLFLARCEEQLN